MRLVSHRVYLFQLWDLTLWYGHQRRRTVEHASSSTGHRHYPELKQDCFGLQLLYFSSLRDAAVSKPQVSSQLNCSEQRLCLLPLGI